MIDFTQKYQGFQGGLLGQPTAVRNPALDSVIQFQFGHSAKVLGILRPSNRKHSWFPDPKPTTPRSIPLTILNAIALHLLCPPAHLKAPICNSLTPVTGGGAPARCSVSNSESARCRLALQHARGSSRAKGDKLLSSLGLSVTPRLLSGADRLAIALSRRVRLALVLASAVGVIPGHAPRPVVTPGLTACGSVPLLVQQQVSPSSSHAAARKHSNLPSHLLHRNCGQPDLDDWSNLDVQLQHANHCHSVLQRDLLLIAREKVTMPMGTCYGLYWKQQAAWHSYDSTASIIACSSYHQREDFLHCGYTSFQCQGRLLCPRCAYRMLVRPIQEEFGDALTAADDVYFVVASLSVDPDEEHRLIFREIGSADIHHLKSGNLTPPCTPEQYGIAFDKDHDLLQCRILWELFADAIKHFTGKSGKKRLLGAFGGPELAFRLSPTRALPHSNYVAWAAPGFTVDDARKIRRFLRERMRNSRRLQSGLYPSLAFYRLATPDDLRRVISYMGKPLDLAGTYQSAAEGVHFEPSSMAILNQETNRFLSNMRLVFDRLPRLNRYGQCSSAHRGYFGVVTHSRQLKRDRDAERRAAQRFQSCWPVLKQARADVSDDRLDRWEKRLPMLKARQRLRPRSRFYYWRQAVEPPPPPRLPGQSRLIHGC